jgi:hypothetical protein
MARPTSCPKAQPTSTSIETISPIRRPQSTLATIENNHPLQRLRSPSRTISLIVHTLGLISFVNSFYWLEIHPNHINSAYGWHFQYLTIIGLLLATLTFGFGVLADLTLSRTLFRLKNVLSVCSAPMEVLISLLYWGLRAINPELVVPKELELPLAPDLGFHAIPSIALVIDLLLLSPPWTITALPSFGLSVSIAMGYWWWIERCYERNGFYPYPIFDMVPWAGRVGLFVGSAVVMAMNTAVLGWVYGVVNGRVGGAMGKGKVGKEL